MHESHLYWRNSDFSRENKFPSVIVFGFPSVKTQTLPWKCLQNCHLKNRHCKWKFLANRIREDGTAVREKLYLIKITSVLENSLYISKSARENKMFNPCKFSKIIDFIPSEKNPYKMYVETLDCPWENGKKCAWEPVFYQWVTRKRSFHLSKL